MARAGRWLNDWLQSRQIHYSPALEKSFRDAGMPKVVADIAVRPADNISAKVEKKLVERLGRQAWYIMDIARPGGTTFYLFFGTQQEIHDRLMMATILRR